MMSSQTTEKPTTAPLSQETLGEGGLHIQPRHDQIDGEATAEITGYDHERMKDRGLLSYEEEKKLLRRVDLRLMIMCALIFMVKNIDANNVRPISPEPRDASHLQLCDTCANFTKSANAPVMNRGTPRNILTQLNMTTDDYNWVSTVYYVCCSLKPQCPQY